MNICVHAPQSVSEPPPPPPSMVTRTTVRLAPADPSPSLKSSLDELEKKAILDALETTNGNQSAAARLLGIGRHALLNRLDAYGITRPLK